MGAHIWIEDLGGELLPDPWREEHFEVLAHHPGFPSFLQRACMDARSVADRLKHDPFTQDVGLAREASKWKITQWTLANLISAAPEAGDVGDLRVPLWTEQAFVVDQGDSWVLRLPQPVTSYMRELAGLWAKDERRWPSASEVMQSKSPSSDLFQRPKEHPAPRAVSLLPAYELWCEGELTGNQVYEAWDFGDDPPTPDVFLGTLGSIHRRLTALSTDGLPVNHPTASRRAEAAPAVRD